MKNLRTGIVFMVTAFVALSSCKKEKPLETISTPSVVSPINEGPSNTELISGNYTISLAVVNGDTVSSSDQWMDQTYVINADGTGMQLLHAVNDSSVHTFEKPLEWYFGENEETWSMRTKDLDDNGNPVEEWGDWIPFDILKLTAQEFWHGLNYPEFSMEFHLTKLE